MSRTVTIDEVVKVWLWEEVQARPQIKLFGDSGIEAKALWGSKSRASEVKGVNSIYKRSY
jgi:hypothetical protein